MQNPTFNTSAEPTVEELLTDPIASLLMARDGVRLGEVHAIVDRAQTVLRQHPLEAAELTVHREEREEEVERQKAYWDSRE